MTGRPPTNIATSMCDRLLNRSRKTGEDYNFLLQRYTAERFLYRLGKSSHREKYVLKGAMLFALWRGPIKRGESKTLEFKSTLRWNLKEDRKDDKNITLAVLKTVSAFLNTEGGDLLIGVADNGDIVGIERDQLDNDDKFMRHLTQALRNGMGDRASTCIDPKTQIVNGKTVCVVSYQRSPEPVYVKWKDTEADPTGDFYVRSGPGSIKLGSTDTAEYIKTRFASLQQSVDATSLADKTEPARGSVTSGIPDLGLNPAHLEDLGRDGRRDR